MLSIKDGESLDPLFKDAAPRTVVPPDEGNAGPESILVETTGQALNLEIKDKLDG